MEGSVRFLRVALLVSAVFTTPSIVVAQTRTDTQSNALDEIVVVAQKRTENLQNTPIAVTALSSEALAQKGVITINDVAKFVPNTIATTGFVGNPNDSNFFIRGFGQEDPSVTRDPGVGLYLDGVYLGRAQGAALENLDIERIEVLRGPQGTLYGRNTIGGAVNIITSQPQEELSGAVELRAGSRRLVQGKGYVTGAVVPGTILASLAMTSKTQQGWGRSRVSGDTLGDVNQFSVRGKLLFKLGGDVSFLVIGDLSNYDGTNAPSVLRGFTPGITPFGIPLPSPTQIGNQVCASFCRDSFQGTNPTAWSRVRGVSGVFDAKLGALGLKSITAYRVLKQLSPIDTDGSSFDIYDQYIRIDQDQVSQELNLSGKLFDRLNFLLGGFYYKENVQSASSITFGSAIDRANPATLNNPAVRLALASRVKTESWALFGQATLNLTDALSVTGGIRYTNEKKSIGRNSFIDNRAGGFALSVFPTFPPGVPGAPPPAAIPPILLPLNLSDPSLSYEPITWRGSVEYKISADILAYASATRGFRSGGFNAQAANSLEAVPFGPETNIAYEVGLKTELFDRKLRFNVAAFHTTYKSIQLQVPGQGGISIITNAGKAKSEGVEVDFSTARFGGFSLNGSAGYLIAEYTDVPAALVASIRPGDPLPYASRWSLSLGADQRFDFAGGEIRLGVDASYRSRYGYFSDRRGADPQPGYTLVNARISWTDPTRKFTVGAFGKNIFDTDYYLTGVDQRTTGFGVRTAVPAAGAEFGGDVSFRF